MSLLGEEVVEEWLKQNGYFTIREKEIGGLLDLPSLLKFDAAWI
jgi:hypothetical protein